METELIKTISSIPFDMYKSRYYVSNSIDAYRNLWEIYYRKSKKSKYVIRVQKWNNVVSIVAGDERSFALINDGTVASTFSNRAQKLDFSSWENIISFNSWDYLSVGIRKDNRIKPIYDDRWTSDTSLTKLSSALDQLYDIAYADIGYGFVIGLMKDGSLVSCGHNEYGACKVEHWKLW